MANPVLNVLRFSGIRAKIGKQFMSQSRKTPTHHNTQRVLLPTPQPAEQQNFPMVVLERKMHEREIVWNHPTKYQFSLHF